MNLIIAEAESSPINCRIVSPGEIKASSKKVRNPIGIYPIASIDEAILILNQLDYNFTN